MCLDFMFRLQQIQIRRHGSDCVNMLPYREKFMVLKQGNFRVGEGVSINKSTSRIVGSIAYTRDHEWLEEKLTFHQVIFLCSFKCFRAGEILGSICLRTLQDRIKSRSFYHTDNGVCFAEKLQLSQNLDFSGVGARHQHGLAELAIQTIS